MEEKLIQDPSSLSILMDLFSIYEKSEEKIWALQYGEALSILTFSDTAPPVLSKRLYNIWANAIKWEKGKEQSVALMKVASVMDDNKIPFEINYEMSIAYSIIAIPDFSTTEGLTLEQIYLIKDGQHKIINNKNISMNSLLKFESELIKKGLLRAYVYSLYQDGNPNEYKTYYDSNPEIIKLLHSEMNKLRKIINSDISRLKAPGTIIK